MDNKLKELTDRLYEEGMAKGREEGERLLSKARAEAEALIAEAREKAGEILAAAEKEAADIKTKAESDVRMASTQALQATRKDIENIIIAKMVKADTDAALRDGGFIREIIRTVAGNFSSEGQKDIALVLPETLKSDLEPFVKSELTRILGTEVKASFSKKIEGGFTIGPADGSYFISMSDDTFTALISEYLRPLTKKLLYG